MNSDPRHEGPDDGKAFAEPTGIPKIVDEIVEHVEAAVEHVEHKFAPAHTDTSHPEPDGDEDPDNVLNKHQLAALHDLRRLHRTLRGPQGLLESAGHFNRPFPPGRVVGGQGG
jgi:hypothetical protein